MKKKIGLGKGPEWLKKAVIYQVYPQSYYDSNGDGIGDLEGIIQKLDYIQSLGVNCVWLNPIYESPFHDAGYDVADFYKIAPRYGTRRDLQRLIRKAHSRGIRICFDLCAGHTSFEAEWFKKSCQPVPNKYSDWYVWTRRPGDHAPQEKDFVKGWGERSGEYLYKYYFHHPALNYGYYKPDPAYPWQKSMNAPACRRVKEELKRITSFWMDMGLDGFRVDIAGTWIQGDPKGIGIRRFWTDYRKWFQRKYPEGVLISEWSEPDKAIEAGFHIDMIVHYGCQLAWWELFRDQKNPGAGLRPGFFSRSGKGDIRAFLDIYLPLYRRTKSRGYISLPAANHDVQRPSLNRTMEDLKVVHVMLLTLPGVPLLYYGDEIGMRYRSVQNKEGGYKRSGSRTPMQWNRARNAGFSTAASRNLYLPVDPAPDYPCVEDQETDENSLLNLIRRLLRLRRECPALSNEADFEPVYAKAGRCPFVYRRRDGKQSVLVAVNPSSRRTVARITDYGGGVQPMLCRNVETRMERRSLVLRMGGRSYAVFREAGASICGTKGRGLRFRKKMATTAAS